MVRQLIFYMFFLFASACLWGQSDTMGKDSIYHLEGPDQLLWYRGKKKNDTTLVTSNGTTVSVNRANNNVEVKIPEKKNPFQPLIDEFLKSQQRELEAKTILLSGKDALANYPVYLELKKAYEHEKKVFQKITSNQIELPKVDEEKAIQTLVDKLLQQCQQKQTEFNEIVDFVKQHKADKDFNLPVPPDMDYEHCWDCQPEKQELFDKEVDKYIEDFFREESQRIRNLFELERNMMLLGFNEKASFNGNTNDPLNVAMVQLFFSGNKNACSWMPSAMSQTPDLVYRLINHAVDKAYSLFKKYKKDYHHLVAVTRVLLSVARDRALIMGDATSGDYYLPQIASAFGNFLYDYRERFRKPDYYVFTNTRFYFDLARQYLLAGGDQSKNEETVNWFLKYNRFKLHLDIDCKQGAQGGYILAHLKGDNYVRIVPDSTDCVAVRLIESGDAGVKEQNLKLHLEAVDVVSPPPRPIYVGTHNWETSMPDIRFHLCESRKDTIIAHAIFPEGFRETWSIPGMGSMSAGIVQGLLMLWFEDQNHVDESVSEVEGHKGEIEAEFQKQAAKMKTEAEKYRQGMTKGKAPTMEQQAKWKRMTEDMLAISNIKKYAPHRIGNFFFPITLKNEKVMIDESLDGKKLFPDNTGIIYAFFKIQLAQEPRK